MANTLFAAQVVPRSHSPSWSPRIWRRRRPHVWDLDAYFSRLGWFSDVAIRVGQPVKGRISHRRP